MRGIPLRGTAVLLLVTAFLSTPAALADGPAAGADLHVAQSLGARELTVVLRRVDGVPGPLRVDVVTHAGTVPGSLRLRLASAGVSETTVALGATPGVHGGTVEVGRPGPHELVLDDGTATASIPFVVPVSVLSPAERATYAGFAAAGLLLALALVAALRARRGWVVVVPTAGFGAVLAVAVTAAVLSASTPAPPVPGEYVDATVDAVLDPYSLAHPALGQATRPPATMLVRPTKAGDGVDLVLSFTDSASGRPVDDLLVHDSAFVHLLVVTPSLGLRHLHPVRVGPGEYRVHVADTEPGHYALAAEVSRRGGGVQLLRSPTGFDVDGQAPPVQDAAATQVDVSNARSGEPTTIVARFGDRADLQPWLGMVGHLIAVGPLPDDASTAAVERAPLWAHVHAMAPARRSADREAPDETVAAYGPEASFTHTFPLPGRYRVWVQAQRDYELLTVPVWVDVAAGTTASGR
ncbi:hypothetical protein ACFFQW_41350 [Umezawaea endophytica]|uniref:Secreted protein n=1 Tax=Umezawaea endophytica TaxID=1654476 RepID=A0A9X2VJY8_9PSEU|nr:hypothetical protein [Umezawaea endophytica]MCS7477912.1 hypothetical protein [Umezawaea endophytica]